MATPFEFVIVHPQKRYARQAACAAFELIDDLEHQLSYFVPTSDVAQINRLSAGQSMRVSQATLQCIQAALHVGRLTAGAFDLTVGSLLIGREPWVAESSPPPSPSRPEPLTIGMDAITVNPLLGAVAARADHVEIDLGGIGKGFALDQAAQLLRDWGITLAMLSAGRSTMLPIGSPADGWRMQLLDPRDERIVRGQFRTRDRAVSMSSSSPEKPHVLDPQTGEPVQHHLGAWALAPSAAWADALSTAFLVMTEQAIATLCDQNPSISGIVLLRQPQLRFSASGQWDDLACNALDHPGRDAARDGAPPP
jgi:thiamine biosynthesis lipoprotein